MPYKFNNNSSISQHSRHPSRLRYTSPPSPSLFSPVFTTHPCYQPSAVQLPPSPLPVIPFPSFPTLHRPPTLSRPPSHSSTARHPGFDPKSPSQHHSLHHYPHIPSSISTTLTTSTTFTYTFYTTFTTASTTSTTNKALQSYLLWH